MSSNGSPQPQPLGDPPGVATDESIVDVDMANSEPAESPPSRLAAVVARITGVNFLLVVLAFVTSPILARALGPSGRGEVAAIFSIVSLAPWISELGMTAFLSREHARRSHPLGVLLGSTMPVTIGTSLIGVAVAFPLAHLIGHGRPLVVDFIAIGLGLLPLSVFAQTLYGIMVGESRWNLLMLSRLISTAGVAIAIVGLSLLGELTVATAATSYIACGIIANLPFLVGLRGSWPWRFVPAVTRAGVAFGAKSWIATVANTGNVQLDQVLMAGLVSSRQLGLYSLAVTISLGATSLVGAATVAIFPRVAAGDAALAARACRVTLSIIFVFDIGVAVTCPVFVPVLFGGAFTPLIPMLLVLLLANLFAVGSGVLGSSLMAAGHPSANAYATFAGLVVTVPALIVVLPIAGGLGAAWVSLASYAVTFIVILVAAGRAFDTRYRVLLVVTRRDLRWVWLKVRHREYLGSVSEARGDMSPAETKRSSVDAHDR